MNVVLTGPCGRVGFRTLERLLDAGHTVRCFDTRNDFPSHPAGFNEACEPRHLPWRHAHDIVNFLAFNCFDAALNGSTDALDRLEPANLAAIEDLTYQRK